ncbi:hypothetical protein GH865_11765 [Rhodocyclus tenuis]|uniref:hypothetical protein n=1 Tax=Rhodocyclus gracilis TaxID=2929842 RepID=UPI001298E50E|nr:hypothetical protein [Rhodocyclus gracilis]MRD73917.1 hypothetical protein [Rhodocyclus gracilis]
MNTPQQLTPAAALQALDSIRDKAASRIAEEMAGLAKALTEALTGATEETPEETLNHPALPQWVKPVFQEATTPEGGVLWPVARLGMSAHCALLMASEETPEGVTGKALAELAGVDLVAFAAEVWAGMTGPVEQEGF